MELRKYGKIATIIFSIFRRNDKDKGSNPHHNKYVKNLTPKKEFYSLGQNEFLPIPCTLNLLVKKLLFYGSYCIIQSLLVLSTLTLTSNGLL